MKKSITILFVVILILMLAACGSGESHTGEAKTPSSSSVMKGVDYESVIESFEENGFTNIKLEKIEDLITGWLTKDGEVEEVSVGGDVGYAPGKWVPANTEVIIRYHTFATESVATEPNSDATESVATEPISEKTPTQESQVENIEETVEGKDQTDEVLTVDNCEDLAVLLLNKNEPYETYENFASKYEGRTIEFDGRIDYIVNHENYNTRYDILVSAGDYNPDTEIGPTFKFENISLIGLGFVSDTVSIGMNVRITAIVEEFIYDTGIFYLVPISVTER